MSLPTQLRFWESKVLGQTRQKLAQLYYKKPEIVKSEKRVLLQYWQTYEGLASVLGDKLPAFVSWFLTATSPETITRCLRSLKEDGTIRLSPEQERQRQEKELAHRHFWAREARK